MKKIVILLSIIIIIGFIFIIINLYNINTKENNSTENNIFKKYNYYKEENLNRYIEYKKNNTTLDIKSIITYVNLNLDKEAYKDITKTKNLNTNYILVNKYNYLEKNYIPNNLVLLDNAYAKDGIYLVKEAKENLEKLIKDSKKENLNIRVISAYRSYNYQERLYNNYVKDDGVRLADTYSARPGFSEHQTGLVIDVTKGFDNFNNFENTKEYKWLLDNSYKYGFILRYPKGKENITLYNYESWHYRYVGKELAKKIKVSNLTFDEYYIRYLNK